MQLTNTKPQTNPFYVIARESGTERHDLPVWASRIDNPVALEVNHGIKVSRQEVLGVPGAFQLLNVLSPREARAIIDIVESLGFTQDAAVSLPREIRHNSNLNWIADDTTTQLIWERCKDLFVDEHGHFMGKKPLGINGRFRIYRYQEGDYFQKHSDGAWPGSRVIDGALVTDAYGDRYSMYTFLILLNEDFQGGETQFWVNKSDPSKPARRLENADVIDVRTPAGGVLCFPHGTHPCHCIHASAPIASGNKYIIRSDVLFEL